MGICTEFAPRSASWFKAAVLGLACLAAAAGQSVTVDSGPVLTESVANPTHSANCPVTAPPTVSAFHAGDPVTIEADGWYARILQHEIDHLDGHLYIDRMDTRTFTTVRNSLRFSGQ